MNDDNEALTYWADAAMAVGPRLFSRTLTPHHIAQELRWMEQTGYIVSPLIHDELRAEYADRLAYAEQAADDLVYQVEQLKNERAADDLLGARNRDED